MISDQGKVNVKFCLKQNEAREYTYVFREKLVVFMGLTMRFRNF